MGKTNNHSKKKQIEYFMSSSLYDLKEEMNKFMKNFNPNDIINVSIDTTHSLKKSYYSGDRYELEYNFIGIIVYLKEIHIL